MVHQQKNRGQTLFSWVTENLGLAPIFLLCLCVSVVNIHAQTRSTPVVDQMVEALGGKAFLDTTEIHTTGRFFAFTRGELSGSDVFADYIKFPDMERTEFGLPKSKTISINRGKEGWKVEPRKD